MAADSTQPVWDIFVRFFHWSLVLGFVVAFVTHEDVGVVHIYAGYVVAVLLLLRVAWGFMGSQHARFGDFVYSPQQLGHYLSCLLKGKPKRYLGHNPADGWMVVLLLLSLSIVSYSGLKVYALEDGLGPLATDSINLSVLSSAYADDDYEQDDDDDLEGSSYSYVEVPQQDSAAKEFWEELHESSTHFTLLLIALHLLGVMFSSWKHRENLVKAMFNGRKRA